MIEIPVVALVKADAGMTAVVDGRVSPDVLPLQPELPAITYLAYGPKPEMLLDGSTGWATERIRFKCLGTTAIEAGAAADALHNLFDTFSGLLPNDGPVIQVVESEPFPDTYQSARKAYVKTIDFIFSY